MSAVSLFCDAVESIALLEMGAGPEAAVERRREQGDDPFSLVKEECNQDILYSERCAIFWNETLVCLEI